MSTRNAQTATLANVASTTGQATIFAANGAALARYVFNDSTAVLYLAFDGSTASSTNYSVQMAGGAFFEFPQPLIGGAITGTWASANGNARTTEVTK